MILQMAPPGGVGGGPVAPGGGPVAPEGTEGSAGIAMGLLQQAQQIFASGRFSNEIARLAAADGAVTPAESAVAEAQTGLSRAVINPSSRSDGPLRRVLQAGNAFLGVVRSALAGHKEGVEQDFKKGVAMSADLAKPAQ